MPPQPIIVAPTPTPFTKDESIDHALLAESVEKWCLTELSGFVLGTYGGEEFHLGEPDKLSIIDTVVQAHQGRRFVIAGIDTLSPTEAVRLAGLYAEHGADFVRVRIPPRASWSGVDADGEVLQQYFAQVTVGSPVPVIIIHQPKPPTGSPDATPQEIAQICSLPNVHAYIMGLEHRTESLVAALLPPSCPLWACNGSLLAASALLGAVGACCFFANCAALPH